MTNLVRAISENPGIGNRTGRGEVDPAIRIYRDQQGKNVRVRRKDIGMPLTGRMKLQRSRIKPMTDAAGTLYVFTLEDKTNLPRFVLMILKPKPAGHERFGDANSIELATAELGAEAVYSEAGPHTYQLEHACWTTRIPTETTLVLYLISVGRQIRFMRSKIILIARAAAAMIVGYAVIVLLTSLGFNGVLGGRPIYGGPPLILAAGMLVAVIAGVVGGYIAGLIGPSRGLVNALLVLLPLIVDTSFVLFFFKPRTAPFWFDATASATLMACTLCGGLLSDALGRAKIRDRRSEQM